MALKATPPRSVHILSQRLLENRTAEACAALYGVSLSNWNILFFRAARDFEAAIGSYTLRGEEIDEATRLAAQLPPALSALEQHSAEIKKLLLEAQIAFEDSPAFQRQEWLRRIAIFAILALSAFFYWQQKRNEKPLPYAPYLTEPKKH